MACDLDVVPNHSRCEEVEWALFEFVRLRRTECSVGVPVGGSRIDAEGHAGSGELSSIVRYPSYSARQQGPKRRARSSWLSGK